MARPANEAERLRRCRLVFERSASDGVPMAEAKKRLSLDEIAERARRIEQLRRPHGGTVVHSSNPSRDQVGFIDRVAAGRAVQRSSTEVYARHCALIGERLEEDDA